MPNEQPTNVILLVPRNDADPAAGEDGLIRRPIRRRHPQARSLSWYQNPDIFVFQCWMVFASVCYVAAFPLACLLVPEVSAAMFGEDNYNNLKKEPVLLALSIVFFALVAGFPMVLVVSLVYIQHSIL